MWAKVCIPGQSKQSCSHLPLVVKLCLSAGPALMDVLSLEVPLGPILGEGAAAVGLFIVAQEQEVAGGPRIRM